MRAQSGFVVAALMLAGCLPVGALARDAVQAQPMPAGREAPAAGAPSTGAAAAEGSPSAGAAATERSPASASGRRPTIALALSGGGARGAAHVGVLKVLEELRVPVDCVAGASMGAIVGGVYAAGMSVDAMERTITGTDWRAVFDDAPPRAELSMRRKAEDYRGLADPEFGVGRNGLSLPKGVISGVTLESFLRLLTQPVLDVDDFSRLPIPFRAVATDIVSGETVVLDRGNLSQALRASMAIPGAVSPVEIDGRLLVDGGVTDNLPIDLARATCDADVIIAVNIQTPLLRREDITSAVGVLGQLVNLLGKGRVDRQLAGLGDADVLISPELGDISAGSFERTPDAIVIGEAAARELTESLRRYSLPPQEYAELRVRQASAPVRLGRVDGIAFEGHRRTNPEVLRSLVNSRPGEPLTEEGIASDLRRVYGRGDFERVDYRIAAEEGRRTLTIGVQEKATGPGYLRFGLGFATDFEGASQVNVRGSYRRTWINSLGGELLLDAQFGRHDLALGEWYQPLAADGRYFVAPYLSLDSSRRAFYLLDRSVAELRTNDSRAGIDVGAVFGTIAEARLGVAARRASSSTVIGLPLIADDDETARGLRARVLVDALDRPYFSRDGYALWLDAYAWKPAGESDQAAWRRIDGRLDYALSAGRHTWNLSLQGASPLGTELPVFDKFTLGGPFRLSGYPMDRYMADGYVFARLQYYQRTYALPNPLGTGVYAGVSLEAGRLYRQVAIGDIPGTLGTAAFFLGADTFVGPVYLLAGFAPDGNRALHLVIGLMR
ncbi:MAG TPA: patatin-like phospholipase family protein [Quisquiliibacterium sp.]|nr:patatin-like phospholipase family protein [Quisquiliibacterium sp.]